MDRLHRLNDICVNEAENQISVRKSMLGLYVTAIASFDAGGTDKLAFLTTCRDIIMKMCTDLITKSPINFVDQQRPY